MICPGAAINSPRHGHDDLRNGDAMILPQTINRDLSLTDVGAMLMCIPADDRDTWVKCGMAVKSALGDAGFPVWDAWSQSADNYSERAARDVWRSVKNGGIGPGTLVHIARDHGWHPDKPALMMAPAKPAPPPRSSTQDYALQLWQAADDEGDIASQSYAVRKGIKHAAGAARGTASGSLIGRCADCLIIPMRTLDGDLTGVECINPEGVKQTFGNKGVLILGNDLDPALPQLVVEGWATAVAILNLYQWNACVYACFGKGMLERLAVEVATKYLDRQIVIGGESDE
jgi:putative DNA primase/helicase